MNQLTERELKELKEIQLSLLYTKHRNHGASGHDKLVLISKLAKEFGYSLDEHGELMHDNIKVKFEAYGV